METEPPSTLLQLLTIDASTITGVVFIVVLIALLLLSALISGSEVAFFSLGAGELEELEDESTKHNHIRELLSQPFSMVDMASRCFWSATGRANNGTGALCR